MYTHGQIYSYMYIKTPHILIYSIQDSYHWYLYKAEAKPKPIKNILRVHWGGHKV